MWTCLNKWRSQYNVLENTSNTSLYPGHKGEEIECHMHILRASAVECQSTLHWHLDWHSVYTIEIEINISIDIQSTPDWHLRDTSIDTQLTLDRQSVNSWQSTFRTFACSNFVVWGAHDCMLQILRGSLLVWKIYDKKSCMRMSLANMHWPGLWSPTVPPTCASFPLYGDLDKVK